LVLAAVILFNGQYFRPDKLISKEPFYQPTAHFIEDQRGGVIPDYLPPGIDWQSLTPKKTASES